MTIKLQYNATEENALDKNVSDIIELTGTLKAETSIIDPIIVIDGDLSDFVGCNYMTIPDFGRSYFIKNIRSVRKDLVEFSAHVDVLSSFKTQIRTNKAITKKQQNKGHWNLYLNDGTFKVYQNPFVFTVPFPSGFTTQELVFAVAGK